MRSSQIDYLGLRQGNIKSNFVNEIQNNKSKGRSKKNCLLLQHCLYKITQNLNSFAVDKYIIMNLHFIYHTQTSKKQTNCSVKQYYFHWKPSDNYGSLLSSLNCTIYMNFVEDLIDSLVSL